jgi:hypothetical protein
LIRLRIDYCKLNNYLNKRKIIEDPTCEYDHEIEDVKHFLLLYKKYEEPRNELRKEMRCRNMRMKNLFDDPKIVKSTLDFVEKTKRFNFELLIGDKINRFGEHIPERNEGESIRLEIISN